MGLRDVKNITLSLTGLAVVFLACGCEVHRVEPPPVSIQQYDKALSAPNPYPARTVALHNLRRVLDPDLGESERVASLQLVSHVGQNDPGVDAQLAGLLAADDLSEPLRQAVLELLVQRDHPGLAAHIVKVLPKLSPDSEMKAKVLQWLERHPAPVVVADIVRLWAQEPSATGPDEPQYRQVVERLSGATWDQALLSGLNRSNFGARAEAVTILAARVPKDQLIRQVGSLQPATEEASAIQGFLRNFGYFPTTAGAVQTCVSLQKGKRDLFPEAALLAVSWRQNYGYEFDIRDFHLVSRLAQDPMRRGLGRTELVLAIHRDLLERRHVARRIADPSGPYDFSDRFEKHFESLSMADLWALRLVSGMLSWPQVRTALEVMAEGDRADDRSAWGGLVFCESGHVQAKLYPPDYQQGDDDLAYRPTLLALQDGHDSLCRFHGHFEQAENIDRAGPTTDELAAAKAGNYRGLVLTSVGNGEFCAHFYTPQEIVISLGTFAFE